MISPTSVNWTMLNALRAMPGPAAMMPPASLLAITGAANLKPAVLRPVLDELIKCGLVREYVTQHGRSYARTANGDARILEVKTWLR